MPRAKKTPQGSPGQAVQAIPGQTYGQGKQQEALQKAMPAPNVQASTPSARPTAQPTQQMEAPQPVRQPVSMAEISNALQGMGGVLREPDDRPTTPVSDGLSVGPGRGPEALQRTTRLGNTLRRLAMQTNDPIFTELASKIGL
jgi:hypothetical protein